MDERDISWTARDHHGKLTLDISLCNSSGSLKPIKMLGYLAALLAAYVFLYLPISQMIYGPPQQSTNGQFSNFIYNESFIATNEPLSCASHNYNTFILSHEPLMIYIENFLTAEESKHLIEIRYLSLPAKCFPFRKFRFLANDFGGT